jgi:HAD superfamily hydrolase (TIGR01662 family)
VTALSWVAFDVGETLVDETRMWGERADRLGIPRLGFFAALGAVIEARRPHREVYALLGHAPPAPDDWWADLRDSDLYPDAAPTLAELRRRGYRVAIVGNQPRGAAAALRRLGAAADLVATSEHWGVAKPAPGFFARLTAETGAAAREIAYVGDRVDNDILPAKAMGLAAVFVRRGPWGIVQAAWPEAAAADLRLENLGELPDRLATLGGAR